MQNYILINGGKKKMYEISEEELDQYKLIGTGCGASMGICMYEGWLHAKSFIDRVYGYHIENHGIGEMMSEAARQAGLPEEKQKYITVSFYESKPI